MIHTSIQQLTILFLVSYFLILFHSTNAKEHLQITTNHIRATISEIQLPKSEITFISNHKSKHYHYSQTTQSCLPALASFFLYSDPQSEVHTSNILQTKKTLHFCRASFVVAFNLLMYPCGDHSILLIQPLL